MYSPLVSWSRYVYLAALVLGLVLIIPTAWFPFQLGKFAVFATLLVVCVALFVAGRGTREVLRAHGFYLVLVVAALPLAYALSALLSIDRSLAIAGYSVDTDTVVFSVVIFLAFVISFALFRTLRSVSLLLRTVFWSLVAIAVFQCIVIMFGTHLVPLAAFADRSTNLVGKWNDLGIVAGLLAMLLLVQAELSSSTLLRKSLLAAGLVVLGVLLGVINFGVLWGVLLAFCVVLALLVFFVQRGGEGFSDSIMSRAPWFAISGALVSLLFIFFGSSATPEANSINKMLTSVFPVSSLEVRPSYSSTLGVISAGRNGEIGRVFVGTGPDTFGKSWLMHKPAEVNQSLFWNLDFTVGFSTLMTALGSVGLFGVLAWLVPLFLVIAGLVRAIRQGVLAREERVAAVTLGLGTFFLILMIILYVPSQNIILLAFTLAGAAFGFLWRQGRSSIAEEAFMSRMGQLGTALVALVLLVLAGWSAFAVDRMFLAQANTNAAASSAQSGNIDAAFAQATRAQKIQNLPDTQRLIVSINNYKLQQIAQDKTLSQAEAQQKFTTAAQEAVTVGQQAVTSNPDDYRAHLSLAQLYDFLATLKVPGAYESAKQSYQNALALSPSNPSIPLAIARLEATKGDLAASETALAKALTMKSNYTDAILLAVQLSVAKNDLPNAIRAATAAVQTAPGVAPIWFQLGLLYYAGGDTEKAALALQQAVSIVPDYANAKYFLGLSYYAQKKTADALVQFQDLQKTNPDNAEVKLILSNMAAGKDPFASSTPPFTPPEDRPKAPIAQ